MTFVKYAGLILFVAGAALAAETYHAAPPVGAARTALPASYSVRQLTFGPKHHFYGYQGHAGNTPWSLSNSKLLLLQTDFQDRLNTRDDAAAVVLVDEATGGVTELTETRAWNFQQGTMMYWNPQHADTEFFFNDRTPDNKIKTVLFDIKTGKRRDFFYPATPFGNGGVAQKGGRFLGINYARLGRLRPTTGYPDAYDWTAGDKRPGNDGLWVVDVATGRADLILSFKRAHEMFVKKYPEMDGYELFLNHSLWNRDDTRIIVAVRWVDAAKKLKTIWVTLNPDGTEVVELKGNPGHFDWESGERIQTPWVPSGGGNGAKKMAIVDTRTSKVVGTVGANFFAWDGNVSLSGDLNWITDTKPKNSSEQVIVWYSRAAGAGQEGPVMKKGEYCSCYGEWNSDPRKRMLHLNRIDGDPVFNRDQTKIYYFGLADDGTRQTFVITLKWSGRGNSNS